MYAEFHCILCLLVNDFQGQWKKRVLGVQLPTLLADTYTRPLPFLTVLLLHRFLSNMVFVSPKTVLIFYLIRFSLEKLGQSELCHTGNRIEVIRHSTAKLNRMKTDKYNAIKHEVEDDNIKIEVPDEIATDMNPNFF